MAQVIDAASKEMAQWAKELTDILSILFKSGTQTKAELLKVLASKKELKKIADAIGAMTNGGKDSVHWCAFDENQQDMCNFVQAKLKENGITDVIVGTDSSLKTSIIYCGEDVLQTIQQYRMMYAISRSEPQYCHRYSTADFSKYANNNHVVIINKLDKDVLLKLQADNLGTKKSFPFTTSINDDGSVNMGIKAQHFMSLNNKDMLTMMVTSNLPTQNDVARYEYALDKDIILNENHKDFYVVPLEASKKGVFLRVMPEGIAVYNSTGKSTRYIERPSDEKTLTYFAAEVLDYLKDIPNPCAVTDADVKAKTTEEKDELAVLSEHVRQGVASDFVRINAEGRPVMPRATLSKEDRAKERFMCTLIKAVEHSVIRDNIERNTGCYVKLAEQLLMSIYDDSKDDIQTLNEYKKDFNNILVEKVMKSGDYAGRETYQTAAKEAFREVLDEANGVLTNLNHEYGAKLQNDNYEKLMFNFENTVSNYTKDVIVIFKEDELTQKIIDTFNRTNEKIKTDDTKSLPTYLKKELDNNDNVKEWAEYTREQLFKTLSVSREEFYAMSENELNDRMIRTTMIKDNIKENIAEQVHVNADMNRGR